jgi:hypothetical protein
MNRTAAYPEDDLLTPTLTEEDDAVGFERPWQPWSLVVLTFFAGIPAGGSLLALNFSRLGVPRRVLPAVFSVIAATLLFSAWRGWSLHHLPVDGAWRLLSLAQRALESLAAGGLAWLQRRRYRVFRGSGGEPGPVLLPGVLAAVLSLAVQAALMLLFASLFDR